MRLRGRDGESHLVGGGFVETLAFGCDAPSTEPDERGLVTAALPDAPFTLAEAIGASSAFSAAERDVSQYPHVRYWPVTSRTGRGRVDRASHRRRGYRELRASPVVAATDHDRSWCSSTPSGRSISTTTQAGGQTTPNGPGSSTLFWPRSLARRARRGAHNGVFPAGDFAELVAELQGEKRAGRPLVSVRTHTVTPNEWWGIAGGWEVNVCWVYNDQVGAWEQQLPLELRAALAAGRADSAGGPVARFPHYLTRGTEPGGADRVDAGSGRSAGRALVLERDQRTRERLDRLSARRARFFGLYSAAE